MINFDTYLLEFIKTNLVTICFVIAILKAIANKTPWALDNEILQIFTNFLDRNK